MFGITVDKIISKLTAIIDQLDAHGKAQAIKADELTTEAAVAATESQRALRIKAKLQELLN